MSDDKHKKQHHQKVITSTIKFSTSFENISSNGGFPFASGILDSISGMSLWDRLLSCHCSTRFSHQAIVRGAIGLMAAGCCDFADIGSWWTNLPFPVKECVRLSHDHGTSEQFHSELKSGMGIEFLPSGSLATNALLLALAAIAFDCLRLIGDAALVQPKKDSDPKRMRLRTVLLDFIKIGCKLVRHANTMILKVSRCFTYFDALRRVEAIY